MSKPILSISIMVSNRIDTVEKTMRSVKRIMDNVPAELIVVDTVGEEKSDGSLSVAKQYATKVIHFDWINDFAAARNAGLKEATGEWFMFMDDDEEFIEIDDLVDFFNSGDYKNYFCATYKIHDYVDNEGRYVVAKLNRLVKMFPETIFKGRVHEYITPLRLPVKELNSYIDHHGYAFKNEEERLKKFNRNWPLLELEYKDDPWNLRTRLHLIQACMDITEKREVADSLCVETINASKEKVSEEDRKSGNYQWICVAYVKLSAKSDEYEETIRRVDEIRRQSYLSELTRMAIAEMEAESVSKKGLAERSLIDVEEIKNSYRVLRDNPKKLFWQSELELGLYFEKPNIIVSLRHHISAMSAAGYAEDSEKNDSFAKTMEFYRELQDKPALSVEVLVSGRSSYTENCFRSLARLREKTSLEVIAVVTIEEDKKASVTEIVNRYADKTVSFEWIDDFSAARNAGLKEATGEWFMYIDDDEWLDDPKELADFFNKGKFIDYNSACLRIRNYNDADGVSFSEAFLPRLCRLSSESRFENVVKEEMRPLMAPCRMFSSIVHHYGRIYANEEEKRDHNNRDLRYLERAFQEHPDVLEVRAQYADEIAKRDALKGIILCWEVLSDFRDKGDQPWYRFMISVLFRLYESSGLPIEDAEEKYELLKVWNVNDGYSLCAAASVMTRICLIKGKEERAVRYVSDYFDAYMSITEDPEKYSKARRGDLDSFAGKKVYEEMLLFGANIFLLSGDTATAWEFLLCLPWEDPQYTMGNDAIKQVFCVNNADEQATNLYEIIRKIMNNPTLKPVFSALLTGDPNVKQAVDRCLNIINKLF